MAEPTKDVARWLAEAKAGSGEALGELLEACRAYLLMVALREFDPALQPKGGASDLVQQTFLEAHRDFANFRGASEAELLGWLRQILVHNLGHFRRSFRQAEKRRVSREVPLQTDSTLSPGPPVAADTPTPSRQLMDAEQARLVHNALARLPEEYRRVIGLRYDEDRSFAEIGAILNRTENAARKLWARAVERLEQELEQAP